MALSRLGEYIELTTEINEKLKFAAKDVMGMTITKEIIPTKANVEKTNLSKFLVIYPNEFIYNPRTHGKKIGLGFNDTDKPFIISWNNIGFRIKRKKVNQLDPTFLFIYFNRIEWDRWATFNSWGSSTEVFTWETLCDMKFEIPSIEIQKKYVAIYKGLKNNLKAYESNLEDLKLVCDGYVENLRKKYRCQEIGSYIIKTDSRNTDNKIKNVKNVSVYKSFNEPTSKVNRDKLSNYKIVYPKEISFVQTTHNEKVFAYALNNTNTPLVVTPVNEVFKTDEQFILPEFLCLYFNRKEFDRYARFHSWGSARETFVWNDLQKVKIPIPPINIQRDIVDIYNAYSTRKLMIQKLKDIIRNICPILIRGAIKEASEE